MILYSDLVQIFNAVRRWKYVKTVENTFCGWIFPHSSRKCADIHICNIKAQTMKKLQKHLKLNGFHPKSVLLYLFSVSDFVNRSPLKIRNINSEASSYTSSIMEQDVTWRAIICWDDTFFYLKIEAEDMDFLNEHCFVFRFVYLEASWKSRSTQRVKG